MALPRSTLVLALFVTSCAQVPAGICFSDEPCADAGITSGGGQGGGAQGGGTGGGGATGGGTGGGGTGGGSTGGGSGDAGTPVDNIFSSLGVDDVWLSARTGLPAPLTTLPSFTRVDAELDGGITSTPACTEAFRGVVALPDGRALAIPFCANRFAVIDPTEGTAGWLPHVLPAVSQPNDPGNFGGAIFGCDGRVYALPYNDQFDVLRITPEEDGGFTFENLPTRPTAQRLLSGGVIARPCTQGFRIIAAGAGGLYALDPTETSVAVTPIPATSFTMRFNSVARLGDDQVLGATVFAGNLHTLRVDSNTLVGVPDNTPGDEPHFGIATRRGGDAWIVQPEGWGFPIPPSAARNVPSARQRWPTNLLNGWILSAGDALIAWNEAQVASSSDGIVMSPATTDTGSFTSGGLVVTTSGAVINVPAVTGANVITIYRPTDGTPPGPVALAPWFNKL